MKQIETDILVAGGGVAGLIATAVFAAAGFRTLCVDPAPPVTDEADPSADLRSTAFLQPAIDLLDDAGLWTQLAPFATPLRIMRLADAGGPEAMIREVSDFDATELGRDAFGYNLPNWLLRREIVARIQSLAHATLLAPASVKRITPRLSEAVVQLSGDIQVRARLLIAADGRDSFVRESFGIGVRRWRYGQKALVFSVRHELPHDNISTEIHRSGGPFTLVPLPDQKGAHHSAVVWMEAGPKAVALNDLDAAAFTQALNERACGALGALTLASRRMIWPIIAQVADRLDAPRTALVAEAAHVVPPIGAQGLNMSLGDIAALRDLIIGARDAGRDIGTRDLLARYNRARHAEVLARVSAVDLLNRASMATAPELRDLRRAGLRALHGITPLRQGAMKLGLG